MFLFIDSSCRLVLRGYIPLFRFVILTKQPLLKGGPHWLTWRYWYRAIVGVTGTERVNYHPFLHFCFVTLSV